MKIYEVKSFAKINLALHVTGKLANLHKIESVVNFIDLHDKIFIKKIDSNKVQFNAYCQHQGKVIAFFWVVRMGDDFLISFPDDLLAKVKSRLQMFVIMSDVIIEDISDDYLAGILCFIWVLGILLIALYNVVLDRRQKKISKESGEIYELAYNSELERLQGWHLHHAQTIDQLVNDLQDARLGLLQSWESIEHMVPK